MRRNFKRNSFEILTTSWQKYRGLAGGGEKLWIAGVEEFAIGGACQLLHVMDHVIAVRGSRLYLPAPNGRRPA